MTFTKVTVFACAAVLAVSSSAFAQKWGHGRTPRDGACFYKDADFDGEYFCIDAGRELTSISGDMNDRISSVKIYGRAEVTVYKDRNFNGKSVRISNDVRNLKSANWNDAISSMTVRSSHGGYGSGYGSGGGYSGGDPDRIVRRAYEDILGREPDQAGLRLYRSRMIDDGWSEAQVRDTLKNSQEARQKAATDAREIVRRAYVNVLKREPDGGSSSYVDKVLRQHWTQSDVERELRKSPEYRSHGGRL